MNQSIYDKYYITSMVSRNANKNLNIFIYFNICKFLFYIQINAWLGILTNYLIILGF
jgi:hypothetical protein